MPKEVTVQLTLEWSFTKKEWSDEKKHLEELQNDPKVILGEDILSSLHMLNELDYPFITDCKVEVSTHE